MTKKELAQYAGVQFYNLSTRMGGKFKTIYCLTVYEVTDKGTCKFVSEAMSCVANQSQWAWCRELTKGCGFHKYRPTAENLTAEFLERNR